MKNQYKPLKNIEKLKIISILKLSGLVSGQESRLSIVNTLKIFLDNPGMSFSSEDILNHLVNVSGSNTRRTILILRNAHLIEKIPGNLYTISDRSKFFNLYFDAQHDYDKEQLNKLFNEVGF